MSWVMRVIPATSNELVPVGSVGVGVPITMRVQMSENFRPRTGVVAGWSGWGALGGQLGGGLPAVGTNEDGRLETFALWAGATGLELVHLWQLSPGGDWSDWDNLGAPPGGVRVP